ncbi:MAG: hypothetical protein A2170_09885 [Deltaproteobacteria bacterium RBG_13_53_10]|nr:MAG: hypothetical protein A2170_09885 [Deltaproteobacteria bacterium RBG_13_53_10]
MEFDLSETDRRILKDRRRQVTPGFSRFIFFGRRKTFRRKEDKQRGGYVDRYSSALFLFLVLILGLNILDALFTMIILDAGGLELNPIVSSVITLYGDRFWVWKFGIVSLSLILLCLHSKFRSVRTILFGINIVYFLVILHQAFLIIHR